MLDFEPSDSYLRSIRAEVQELRPRLLEPFRPNGDYEGALAKLEVGSSKSGVDFKSGLFELGGRKIADLIGYFAPRFDLERRIFGARFLYGVTMHSVQTEAGWTIPDRVIDRLISPFDRVRKGEIFAGMRETLLPMPLLTGPGAFANILCQDQLPDGFSVLLIRGLVNQYRDPLARAWPFSEALAQFAKARAAV